MTFQKPSDVRFTDMAIWIDNNAYQNDFDVEKMYRYLYHLSYMLAKKRNLFDRATDYDSFSLYEANRLLKRLTNKGQYQMGDNGEPKVKRVKSILNYIKKVINLHKVEYQTSFLMPENYDSISYSDLGEIISDDTDIFDKIGFEYSLGNLHKIVENHLCKIPMRVDSNEWSNIYVSCMLTLINEMTLSKEDRNRMLSIKNVDSEKIDKLYHKQRNTDVILFHLDKKLSGYIRVLVNELRHCIARDLSCQASTHFSSNSVVKGVLYSQIYGGDSSGDTV